MHHISDTWKFYGPEAILVEFGGSPESVTKRVLSAVERLQNAPPNGLREFIPGFGSILLVFRPSVRPRLAAMAASISESLIELRPTRHATPRQHLIEVIYDGPDLDFVCQQTGLSKEGVIALHSRPNYTVALLGFAPGFPYLTPLDRRLQISRRVEPRKRVAPGTVAIGGPHTGIYPIASPGGWHLLGRTNAPLFKPDASQEQMFLLAPGDQVRFIPVESFLEQPNNTLTRPSA